jgi:acyl carrier protein
MSSDGVAEAIRTFIIQSFVHDERPENLPDDLDLIRSGILDSLAIIHTATFLEELAGMEIGVHELTPKNIGSIGSMAGFVRRLRAQS